MINGTHQQEMTTTTPNEILVEENIVNRIPSNNDIPSLLANNEHSISIIQNNNEHIQISQYIRYTFFVFILD